MKKKMREIGQRLYYLLEWCPWDFVDHDRQHDGQEESQRQFDEADAQGVDHGLPEILVLQDSFEILPADPRRVLDGAHHRVLLECQDQTVDGDEVEDDHEDDARQDHGLQLPLSPELDEP